MNKRLAAVCLILEQAQKAVDELEKLDCDKLDDRFREDLTLIEQRMETGALLVDDLLTRIGRPS